MKLSKTSWIILSSGLFVVILAGLGLTNSQQAKEHTEIKDKLTVAEMRLDKVQSTVMPQDLEELQLQLNESMIRLAEDKDRLRHIIESIDVVDEFFLIASYCDVVIMNLSSSKISGDVLQGIPCSMVKLSATVTGTTMDIINFVISLNHDFSVGVVESAQISVAEVIDTGESTAGIQMIIYSYEGA